jgi:hypothetical protein
MWCGNCRRGVLDAIKQESNIVRRSDIKGAGNGLFAGKEIGIEDTAEWYGGVLVAAGAEPKSDYLMIGVGATQIIDGSSKFGDDLGRYINHPPTPHLANVRIGGYNKGKTAIRMIATRKIVKGAEIYLNYGSDWQAKHKKVSKEAKHIQVAKEKLRKQEIQ